MFSIRSVKVTELSESSQTRIKYSSSFVVLVFVAGLLVGGVAAVFISYREISKLENETTNLQSQISRLSGNQTITNQNITIYQNNVSLSQLYENLKDSVVLIRGTQSIGTIEGSGFIYNYSGAMVIITNNHVVSGTTELSVTFSDGNGYPAIVNGTDPYADLAILSVVGASQAEFKPLEIVSSSTLRVGDLAIAIGAPYGLVGTMTTGVISALGRTIREEAYTGGYAIANIIQTSVPINPGNSGGPLLNYDGKVIGITTAIVNESQGLGFAVPSNTILREKEALISSGTYRGHSYLGVKGTDMDYAEAQTSGVNVTYGWKIAQVVPFGPAYDASIMSGDILLGINGTVIKNGDEMSSYLEEHTLPGETAVLDVARMNQSSNVTEFFHVSVVLGIRPSQP